MHNNMLAVFSFANISQLHTIIGVHIIILLCTVSSAYIVSRSNAGQFSMRGVQTTSSRPYWRGVPAAKRRDYQTHLRITRPREHTQKDRKNNNNNNNNRRRAFVRSISRLLNLLVSGSHILSFRPLLRCIPVPLSLRLEPCRGGGAEGSAKWISLYYCNAHHIMHYISIYMRFLLFIILLL